MLKFPFFFLKHENISRATVIRFAVPIVVATHRLGTTDLQHGERNLNACKTPKLEIPLS